MKKVITFIVVALVLAIPMLAEKKEKVSCVGVAIGEPIDGTFDSSYSAIRTSAVDLWILFPSAAEKQLSGIHRVAVDLKTPSGFLYDRIEIPFSADEDAVDPSVEIYMPASGTRAPFHVLRDKEFKGAKHLGASIRLNLAGTSIVNNSLYGQWTADVFVDSSSEPCAATSKFLITP